MNEEEKKSIEILKERKKYLLGLSNSSFYSCDRKLYKEHVEAIETILNLIDKQQKEIKARLEEIDSLYKMMSDKDDKIEKLKEDYQILKDDIEGHRIVYVDTPEFAEIYISKDKIRHIRDKAECMDYYSLNDVIDDLTKLIGDEKNDE